MTQIRNIARPTWAGAILLALVAFAALIGMRAGDAQGAGPKYVGNDAINRTGSISSSGQVFIDRNHPADAAGTIRTMEVNAFAAGNLYFLILDTSYEVKWISPELTAFAGYNSFDLSATPAVVQAGWYVGWYSSTVFGIESDSASASQPLRYAVVGGTAPTVGTTLTTSTDTNHEMSIRGLIGCGATCYANAVTGNNTTGDGRTPATAYQTIQKGIDNVDSAGTVIVAPGSYPESVVVPRAVTITGPNLGIAGNGVRGAEASLQKFLVTGNNVVVDGFRFYYYGGYAAIANVVTNVTFRNNLFDGVYLAGYLDCVNLCTFSRNLVKGAGSMAMFVIGFGATVANNEFRDNNTVNTEVIRAVSASSLNITENYFHDNSWPCGFLCTGEYPIVLFGSSNVSILRNTILSANMGIVIPGTSTGVTIKNNFIHAAYFGVWSHSGPSSGVILQENSIISTVNGLEFYSGHTGPFDATKNWWGDKTGPSGDGPGSGTPIEDLSGQVDFDPWLCLGSDTAPLVPGFQPNLSQQATGTTPCDTSPPIATVTFTTVGGTFVAWPGGWNKNRVIATFTCSDPESGIDENSLPRNLTFTGDGQFTVGIHGLSDDDECVNGMGLVAAPVPVAAVTFRIDRQAPSCASTPSTQYITKLTGFQAVTLPVTTQDGFWTGTETKELISITGDKGATSGDWSGFGTLPVDDVTGTFNTAVKGRTYTLTYKVTDLAGWSDTCTSKVRVTN